MATSSFESAQTRDRAVIDERLREWVGTRASQHATIAQAIHYALFGGGKRVRPLLCLWTHDVFARSATAPTRAAALDAACAVECVHAYSLVHDDLPCMDDDDLRRGQPTVHRRFDEATAVLTGDALLSLAFESVSAIESPPALVLEAVRILARAAGTGGLITGQALDLAHTGAGRSGDIEVVEQIHEFKTARLIAAATELGALFAAGAPADARERARRAGLLIGSAFQIVDDLLDERGDAKTLGKTPGKDRDRNKLTFPAAAGTPAASQAARDRIARALAELPEAAGTPLAALVGFVAERQS